MKAAKELIKMYIDKLEDERKYAQEVQYIFFMEGIGGIF